MNRPMSRLSTTTRNRFASMKKNKTIPLVTPGEFIRLEFLVPLGISPYSLAKSLNVPGTRIHEILKGERSISVDTALRLERFFGLSDGYFLRLQNDYDLRKAKRELSGLVQAEVTPLSELSGDANDEDSGGYLVEHRGRKRWTVKRRGAKRAATVHATQQDAIKSAQKLSSSRNVEYAVEEPKAKYGDSR